MSLQPPATFTDPQRKLWRSLRRSYPRNFTDADAELITLIVEARSRLDAVGAELSEVESLTVVGSTGQPRVHPLVSVEPSLRNELSKLLRQ